MRDRVFYLLVVFWAAWFVCGNNLPHFADDPGVGWHLKTGEWILEHGDVPSLDPFLAGESALRWICDQWLSDLLLYIIYIAGSWQALYFFLFILYFAMYFVIQYRSVLTITDSLLATYVAVILAFKAGLVHFILRPTLFGIFFFVMLFTYLVRPTQLFKSKLKESSLFFLLFVLWANMHPSFIFGLLLLLVYGLSSAMEWRRGVRLLLLSLVATFFNPEMYRLHESVLSLSSSDFFMNLNEEWKPITFDSGAGRLWLTITTILFFGLGTVKYFRKGPGLFLGCVNILFMFLSLRSIRVLPYYGIVSCPAVAITIKSILGYEFFKKFTFFNSIRKTVNQDGNQLALSYSLLVIIFAASVVFVQKQYGPTRGLYPYDIVRYLNQTESEDFRVLASPDLGGFLTLSLERGRAILDDRNTLLGEAPYRKYLLARKNTANLLKMIVEYRVQYYIADKSLDLNAAEMLRQVLCADSYCLYRFAH